LQIKLKIVGLAPKNEKTGKLEKAYTLLKKTKELSRQWQPIFLPKPEVGMTYVTIFVGDNHQNIKVGDEIECCIDRLGEYQTEYGAAVKIKTYYKDAIILEKVLRLGEDYINKLVNGESHD
jgi:hypothetical protein